MSPGSVDVLICRARAAFGRAYDEVSEMPFACRQTTEAIYRESGSGVTERQRQFVDAHMASCPRCRAEHSRAHSPRYLGGLLPWLWLRLDAMSLTGMVSRLRLAGGPIVAGANRIPPAGISTTAKAALGVALTAAILAPGAAVKMADVQSSEPQAFRSELSDQGSRPTMRQMTDGRPGESAHSSESGVRHDTARAGELDHFGTEAHPKAVDDGEHGSSSSDPEHVGSWGTRLDATGNTSTSTHSGSVDSNTTQETHSGSATDSGDGVDAQHE